MLKNISKNGAKKHAKDVICMNLSTIIPSPSIECSMSQHQQKNNTNQCLIKLMTDAGIQARPSELMENQEHNVMLEH